MTKHLLAILFCWALLISSVCCVSCIVGCEEFVLIKIQYVKEKPGGGQETEILEVKPFDPDAPLEKWETP